MTCKTVKTVKEGSTALQAIVTPHLGPLTLFRTNPRIPSLVSQSLSPKDRYASPKSSVPSPNSRARFPRRYQTPPQRRHVPTSASPCRHVVPHLLNMSTYVSRISTIPLCARRRPTLPRPIRTHRTPTKSVSRRWGNRRACTLFDVVGGKLRRYSSRVEVMGLLGVFMLWVWKMGR